MKIELSLKIKSAYVNVSGAYYLEQQVLGNKRVSVIWRRGRRELESKVGKLNPDTHEAQIDDIFKMKTSLEYDTNESKFMRKMSILELIFSETKESIGFHEFDLGQIANTVRNQTYKKYLDLKSDNYPGCQIYIYVNI